MTKGDKYLKQIQQAAGDKPSVPSADRVYTSAPAPVPPRRISRNQFGAFKVTGMGLEVGDNPTEKDWQEVGDYLFGFERSIQWLLGDWLAYGEDVQWGDVPAIAERYGANADTLRNYESVARHCKFSLRREKLSYTHHVAVAREDWTDEQKAMWLQLAEEGEWKTRKLQNEIAKSLLPATAGDTDNTTIAPDVDPDTPALSEENEEAIDIITVDFFAPEHKQRRADIEKKARQNRWVEIDLNDIIAEEDRIKWMRKKVSDAKVEAQRQARMKSKKA